MAEPLLLGCYKGIEIKLPQSRNRSVFCVSISWSFIFTMYAYHGHLNLPCVHISHGHLTIEVTTYPYHGHQNLLYIHAHHGH